MELPRAQVVEDRGMFKNRLQVPENTCTNGTSASSLRANVDRQTSLISLGGPKRARFHANSRDCRDKTFVALFSHLPLPATE